MRLIKCRFPTVISFHCKKKKRLFDIEATNQAPHRMALNIFTLTNYFSENLNGYLPIGPSITWQLQLMLIDLKPKNFYQV